ncbi:MAG: hypothetical protein ACYYK0_05870 [Candidatus Eutrophobiaceae bacterium]
MFEKLIHSSPEELNQILQPFASKERMDMAQTMHASKSLGLHVEQFSCALGFNPIIQRVEEIPKQVGYQSLEDLQNLASEYYSYDIYYHLPLTNILTIYSIAKDHPQCRQMILTLLPHRLYTIENCIEDTIHPTIIQKYREEMHMIYHQGIVDLQFVNQRMSIPENGFRSMIKEIQLIMQSGLLPLDDLLSRKTVTMEEKRHLLSSGKIAPSLIKSLLTESQIEPQERKLLENHLKQQHAG